MYTPCIDSSSWPEAIVILLISKVPQAGTTTAGLHVFYINTYVYIEMFMIHAERPSFVEAFF